MKLRTKLLVAAICGVLSLSGCSSTVEGPTSGEADPRMTNDEFYVDPMSYGYACATGAVIAGASCLLLLADKKALCIAASVGGCAVFMGGNALLDNLRKSYYTREQQLDGLVQQMKLNLQKATYMAETAEVVYQEDHNKLEIMKSEFEKSLFDNQKIRKSLARYDGNILVLYETIDYHKKQLKLYVDTKDQFITEAGNLSEEQRRQIKECDVEIAKLQSHLDAMGVLLSNFIRDRNVLNLAANS